MRILFFCLLFFLGSPDIFGQDAIIEKMNWYALTKPTTNLFVHFDKNVYSNNETVYFTGYIIKEGRLPISSHKVMAIALVRQVDSVLIAEDKFLIHKGLAFGSLVLPDSIPTGNYRFLVYTDKLINNMPEMLFIQEITIKSSIDPNFKANIKLINQDDNDTKSHKVLVSTSTADGKFLPKPAAITYRYGDINKTTFTDLSGQSILTLPQQKNLKDPNVYVKLKYEHDSTFMSLGLPQPKHKANVKFYPEGGNLVVGLASTVHWEVKDQQNRPLLLKAFLLKNAVVIDTIENSSYGIGKFLIRPENEANYSLKLVHSGLIDSTYHLPNALHKGLVLAAQNVVVNDTLRINLKSTEKMKVTLIVHNFNTSFLSTPIITTYENMRLKLPLTDIPKGLTTLTILDSLSRPLAEKIFFAHYSAEEKIKLTTNQEVYKQREKVTLKLNMDVDEDALVSIAAVQNNRLELKKMNDIESYSYLTNELKSFPLHNNGKAFRDQGYLEQILSVKGWRRYTWQDMEKTTTKDTLIKSDSLTISGLVRKAKKLADRSYEIGTMGSKYISVFDTDAKGNFSVSDDLLITPSGKKMYFFVNNLKKLLYFPKIEIHDSYGLLNQQLAKSIDSERPILPSTLQNNTELILKSTEKVLQLKEVVINLKGNKDFNYSKNACGDYVCSYNILNCPNHIGAKSNKLPIKGVQYLVNRELVRYPGCEVPDENTFFKVSGIHEHKEFYQSDYADTNEPAFFSTIYWNYGTIIKSKKEAEISFYTSDITGKFRIIVQGITNENVVYAEHFFEVIEKK